MKRALAFVIVCLLFGACKTTKKKGEMGWFKKAYHNTTAKYNGYYNANVIMQETKYALEQQHEDNYNKILEVYPVTATANPKAVAPELDRAIEKVTTVATIHEPSHWVDDCYLLMGKAQYLKQDYESAEETFKYFVENFDPTDPGSRLYNKEASNKNKEASKRERAQKRAEARKAAEEADEIEKKEKSEVKKKSREQEEKLREQKAKLKGEQKSKDKKLRDEKETVEKRWRNQKADRRKKYNSDKDKLEEDIRNLKRDLSREKSRIEEQARDKKKKEREEAAKKKSRSVRRKKTDKKETTQQTTVVTEVSKVKQLEGQITAKEKAIESLRTSYETQNVQADKQEEQELAALAQQQERLKEMSAKDLKALEEQDLRREEEQQRKLEEITKTPEDDEEEYAAEESSAKKKDAKLNTGQKGGLFRHNPVYHEGVLWLAKTYIERANWSTSEFLLRRLQETAGISEDVAQQIPAAQAHLFIKQKKYAQSIPYLENAISIEDENREKARYAYIMAQIHQMNGESGKAYAAFERVMDFKPDYKLEFNSKLSIARNAWATGAESVPSVLKSLDKMLGENKNSEFQDQIHFTKAEIKLANGDKEAALVDFRKALEESSGNQIQLAESYYRLAQLYYESQDYVLAKSYYDSTAQVMQNTDERYREVADYSKNLTEIASHAKIIQLQDSLLTIANLSEDERQEWAEEQWKLRSDQEQATADAKNDDTPKQKKPTSIRLSQNAKASKFFAYNPLSVQKGIQDFQRKWGDRKLEDDWRRSEKQSSLIEEDLEAIADSYEEEDLEDGAIAAILKEIPTSESARDVANQKVENALFNLGTLLRSKLQEYRASADQLQTFERRFPGSKKELDAYFTIYLDYLDLDDAAIANAYVNKISKRYPDSDYAKMLSDPEYAKTRNREKQTLDQYYNNTYATFEKGNYLIASEMIKEASNKFGRDNDMKSKFDLLNAMCKGAIEGKAAYISELKDVVVRNKNTAEETRAKEILRFLQGDKDAFDERLYDEAVEDFSMEEDKLHYVIAVIYDADESVMKDARISISKYNGRYHKLDKLKITDIYLDTDAQSQIILVRSFSNKSKAMDYYDGASINKKDFLDDRNFGYELYAISQRNYRELIKQRSSKNYKFYFNQKYLEK